MILTGIAGNICVLFTANDAYMRDLKIFAPADCIVSNTAADNDHALRQIHTVLKGNVAESFRLTFVGAARRRTTTALTGVEDMTTHPAKLAATTPYWAASATFPQFARLPRSGNRHRRGGCRNDRPERGAPAGKGRQAGPCVERGVVAR